MLALSASILALVIGPTVYHLARNNQKLIKIINIVVSLLILLMVSLEITKHDHVEFAVICSFIVGVLFPFIMERICSSYQLSKRHVRHQIHEALLIFAAAGLCFHALADGIALREGSGELKAAVILHRIPVGAALWYSAKRIIVRANVFFSLALFTIIGYNIVKIVVVEAEFLHILEAYVMGSLLHVLFFSHEHK